MKRRQFVRMLAAFPRGRSHAPWQNPTLTIMALAMRASEYIVEQMRTGEI